MRLALTRALARASGVGGMAGGQMLDLAGEGRFGDREPVDVARLQQMKTGRLIAFACEAGAFSVGGPGRARTSTRVVPSLTMSSAVAAP